MSNDAGKMADDRCLRKMINVLRKYIRTSTSANKTHGLNCVGVSLFTFAAMVKVRQKELTMLPDSL